MGLCCFNTLQSLLHTSPADVAGAPGVLCSVDLRLVQQLVNDMQQASPAAAAPRVVSLNPFTLEDVLLDALVVGRELGLQQQAADAVAALQQRVAAAKAFVGQQPPLKHNVVSCILSWLLVPTIRVESCIIP